MNRKICYIVGAGLSKSLETSRKFRVPLMVDFVAVLADHIDSNVVLTALTSFEKAGIFDWSRREWVELAQRLDLGANPQERAQYADILRRRPSENVEQLLRNAMKKRKGSLYASIAEDRFGFAINTVFERVGWNLHIDTLTRYLRLQFSLSNTAHTFVSYNYDLVLDYCIQGAATGRWSPATGYAIPFGETIQIDEAIDHMRQFKGRGGGAYSLLDSRPASGAPSDILLLKPHGSLNWLVPFEGNFKFMDADPLLLLETMGRVGYCSEFAVEQIRDTKHPEEIAFNAGLFITPPLDEEWAAQIPEFLALVERLSLEALRDADEIVVIGWSMPSTDKSEVARLRKAMANAKSGRKATAVNFNADVAYFTRLADVCHIANDNMRIFNAGFIDFVATLGEL